jgi:hypothetical protein
MSVSGPPNTAVSESGTTLAWIERWSTAIVFLHDPVDFSGKSSEPIQEQLQNLPGLPVKNADLPSFLGGMVPAAFCP